jgi:hypothetical protein
MAVHIELIDNTLFLHTWTSNNCQLNCVHKVKQGFTIYHIAEKLEINSHHCHAFHLPVVRDSGLQDQDQDRLQQRCLQCVQEQNSHNELTIETTFQLGIENITLDSL